MLEFVVFGAKFAFIVFGLGATLRWMTQSMDEHATERTPRLKRKFMLFLLAILVVVALGIGVMLWVFDRHMYLAVSLGFAIVLSGIVPAALFGFLTQIEAIGLQGEGPVVFGREARQALRLPILTAIIGAPLAGALFAALALSRPPEQAFSNGFIAILFVTLAVFGWAAYAIRARVAWERARAEAPPDRKPPQRLF